MTTWGLGGPKLQTEDRLRKKIAELAEQKRVLLSAAHAAVALIRGSAFSENTKALVELKAAIAKSGGSDEG